MTTYFTTHSTTTNLPTLSVVFVSILAAASMRRSGVASYTCIDKSDVIEMGFIDQHKKVSAMSSIWNCFPLLKLVMTCRLWWKPEYPDKNTA